MLILKEKYNYKGASLHWALSIFKYGSLHAYIHSSYICIYIYIITYFYINKSNFRNKTKGYIDFLVFIVDVSNQSTSLIHLAPEHNKIAWNITGA